MSEFHPHLRIVVCINAQGRLNISAPLSVDVLATICNQLESFSTAKGIVMVKHEKNQTILALSNVCRSWRHHITSCKHLFRDIAFDVSSEESIATAGVFLKMLEETEVPISVYARLGQSSDPDPSITRLFTQLHPSIPYIVHFEYDGDMARYRSYLDLPAPNLLFFSDNFDTYPGTGLPLFHGQMPGLRVLTMLSPASQVVWTTSTLLDLTTLNLGFLDMEPFVSLSMLLNLLRGSPRLESVSIQCFEPVVNPNEALQDVYLPHLHTLDLQHNELHTILKYLRIPNVHKVFFCGESHPASGEVLNPTFEATHLFAGLPLLPIFEQPIKSLRLKTTGNRRTNVDFHVHLTADGGFVLQISLFWILDAVPLFNDYIRSSITGLIGMTTLAPQAHVELLLAYLAPSDVPIPIYQPFLLVTNINDLTIQGGFAMDVLSKLTIHAGSQHLLPCLRLLKIVDWLPVLDEEGRGALSSFLESRATGHVPFSIHLVGTEVPCMNLSKSGYVVKREFLKCNNTL